MNQTIPSRPPTPAVLDLLERHFAPQSLERILTRGGRAVPRTLWERSLAAPLRDFLSRPGKEIRARLVETGYELAGGRRSVPPALAAMVELLHAGSLIVDDIQDGSAERRGRPTLHRRHGVPVALTAGNYLYFWPLLLVQEVALTDEAKLDIHRRVAETLVRCHHGQALDVAVRVTDLPRADVPAVVDAAARLKTGSLTALCLWLGGRAAEAAPPSLDALDKFGEEFGACLQMLDDLGGLLSARRRDKGHEDLLCARLTWPWAWLAGHVPAARYERLRQRAREVARGAGEVEGLAADLRAAVGGASAAPVRRRLRKAMDALRHQGGPSPALAALEREAERLEAMYA
jgi:geranylgeranyl pyrophosphate synthase